MAVALFNALRHNGKIGGSPLRHTVRKWMIFNMYLPLIITLFLAPLVVHSPAHAATGTTFSGWYFTNSGFRNYHGYVPSSYHPGTPIPLVVALHGCGHTGYTYETRTGWSTLAEQRGFIVVYPNQNILNNLILCWNWQLDVNQQRGMGEPAIIAGITDYVRSEYTVNPRRINITGMSAGGAMANIMTVAYPDVYAASSLIAGCEYLCDPDTIMTPQESGQWALAELGSRARAVPTLLWQGTADTIVPPSTADRIVGQWATIDGIDDVEDTIEYGQVPNGRSYTHLTYEDSSGHTLIEQYLIDGAGHTYPGGCSCDPKADPSGPDATGLSWKFFVAHAMPKHFLPDRTRLKEKLSKDQCVSASAEKTERNCRRLVIPIELTTGQ